MAMVLLVTGWLLFLLCSSALLPPWSCTPPVVLAFSVAQSHRAITRGGPAYEYELIPPKNWARAMA